MPTVQVVQVGQKKVAFPHDMTAQEIGAVLDRDRKRAEQMARFIERPDYYGEMVNPVESMKTAATSGVLATPIIGDVVGLGMDLDMYMSDPSSRTWFNYMFTAAGLSPVFPAASQVRAAREKIKAFHGSPHDFPPVRELKMPDGERVYQSMADAVPDGAEVLAEHPLGRFDMSKIGTGEGAQAYGYGLYFAESEDAGRYYKDTLIDDSKLRSISARNDAEEYVLDMVKAYRDEVGASPDKISIQWWMDQDLDSDAGIVGYLYRGDVIPEDDVSKAIESVYSQLPPGRLYEVEIDATPDDFLDWHLPLSEQSEKVKASMRRMAEERNDDFMREALRSETNIPGSEVYEMGLVKGRSDDVSDMAASGIQGIKYKDGFSRGKDGGTSNYVVFDDRLITIAKKYGIAIPAAAALLMEQTGEDVTDKYQEI